MEARPREPGSEEYLSSEKYEIKSWDLARPDSLRSIIAKLNRIRKENPALQTDWSLRFHDIANGQLLLFSKQDGENLILVAVNLDPHNVQSGWTNLDLAELKIASDESYHVHDLLGGGQYLWKGAHNYIELSPYTLPVHVFRILRAVT
jgi:starch synthase (maltosyl-transferring)